MTVLHQFSPFSPLNSFSYSFISSMFFNVHCVICLQSFCICLDICTYCNFSTVGLYSITVQLLFILLFLNSACTLNASCLLVKTGILLESGPMPNVMAALPNIGGALCSMPQSLADAHY